MAITYDPTLPTDKDWVRFLVSDTDSSSYYLEDSEISAALTEEEVTGDGKKYVVAARMLELLLTKWAAAGKGIIDKKVGDLQLKKGIDSSSSAAILARIKSLREYGYSLAMPQRSKHFRVLG